MPSRASLALIEGATPEGEIEGALLSWRPVVRGVPNREVSSYIRALVRCTVEALTPNCAAILRTPGRPGAAKTFLIETSMSGAIGTRQARHGLAPGLWRVQIRRTCPRVAWWITRPACHSWPAGGGQQMTIKITPGL